jgi:hypothetical protein
MDDYKKMLNSLDILSLKSFIRKYMSHVKILVSKKKKEELIEHIMKHTELRNGKVVLKSGEFDIPAKVKKEIKEVKEVKEKEPKKVKEPKVEKTKREAIIKIREILKKYENVVKKSRELGGEMLSVVDKDVKKILENIKKEDLGRVIIDGDIEYSIVGNKLNVDKLGTTGEGFSSLYQLTFTDKPSRLTKITDELLNEKTDKEELLDKKEQTSIEKIIKNIVNTINNKGETIGYGINKNKDKDLFGKPPFIEYGNDNLFNRLEKNYKKYKTELSGNKNYTLDKKISDDVVYFEINAGGVVHRIVKEKDIYII